MTEMVRMHRGLHHGSDLHCGTDVQRPASRIALRSPTIRGTEVQCRGVQRCTSELLTAMHDRSADAAAQRTLDEAHARGWRIELVNDWPTITASLDSMSPALVDRLKEHADVIAMMLREAGR